MAIKIPDEIKEFRSMIQISSYIIFEVSYYTLGSNKSAHFTTSANQLNKRKNDYTQCGQAQESLLPKGSPAYEFYEKWDGKHLSELNLEEYQDLIKDLNELGERYNLEFINGKKDSIPFPTVVEFSKKTPMPMPKPKTKYESKNTDTKELNSKSNQILK